MSKVLVYSTFYGSPWFTSLSIRNHLNYCLLHGYDYLPALGSNPLSRQFSWAKIWLGLQHLKSSDYEYIFWMDADSFFLNTTIRIEDLVAGKKESIFFSGDSNDIFNGGHFILRRQQESIDFLMECWKVCNISDERIVTTHKDDIHLYDQPGILSVLGGANPDDPSTWADGFNSVNGFAENPYRFHKNFQADYAPTSPEKCELARSLICEKWRPHCYVYPQRVMNSYPWFMGPDDFIVHFVGNTKHLMTDWREHFTFYPS